MIPRRHSDPLLRLVESFFRDYLQQARGVSRHTVLAYRDALRLFFSFLAEETKRPVAKLALEDLTVDRVLAFLDHLESDRHNSVSTRNVRLTAIRSFFRHLIQQDMLHVGQFQRVLSLPLKKTRPPVISYLEPEEVQVLLRQPDRRIEREARDHALLLFLYNTGSRISEALAVRRDEIQLARPRQVRLHGKGRKDRVCPLWPDTAKALKRLVDDPELPRDAPVFRSTRGGPLSRDGAAHLLRKYLQLAVRQLPNLRRKHVTPHVLRHSCAVALLQAGVDLTVIRDYLGHESIATTGRYTRANLQMKRRVLDAFWKRAGLSPSRDPRWRPAPDLLAFLTSL
jgi:site-specific recombinase XerD